MTTQRQYFFFGGGYIKWPYTNILIQSAKLVFQTDVILESDLKPKSKGKKNKQMMNTGKKDIRLQKNGFLSGLLCFSC